VLLLKNNFPQVSVSSSIDASFVTQEIFGPIRSVFKYKTVDEAIRRANKTSYGLGGLRLGEQSK